MSASDRSSEDNQPQLHKETKLVWEAFTTELQVFEALQQIRAEAGSDSWDQVDGLHLSPFARLAAA